MLQGINILGFYLDFSFTRWNNTDIKEFIVTYVHGTIPKFITLIQAPFENHVGELIDAETNEVLANLAFTVTVGNDGYRIVEYTGGNFNNGTIHNACYIKIKFGTNLAESVCSEVFAWSTTLSGTRDFIKFSINSSNITIGGKNTIPFSNLGDYDFYLSHNGISMECEISEDGVEKPYGNLPVFNTLNIKRTIEINGTKDILRFLFALRIFETNGTIEIYEDGLPKQIYNIEVEPKDDSSFSDNIIINFTYREVDYISARNEI